LKIFIVGPHLSGLGSRGQRVTVGKARFSIGNVIVSKTVIDGLVLQSARVKRCDLEKKSRTLNFSI
jgi:hypothetical protein